MPKTIDTHTFNQLAKDMATHMATANHYFGGIDSYSQPAGVAHGMEIALYYVYGYTTVDDGDGGFTENSVAKRVKDRALEIVEDWAKTDRQLNGRYTLAGVDVLVSSPYNGADYRYVGIGDNDTKNVPNTDVLSMIVNGLLVKKEEPADEITLDAMVADLEERANAQ